MISLMIKAATKPPIILPSPPSTQIMNVSGPKVLPIKGCTSYCSESCAEGHEPRVANIDAAHFDDGQPHADIAEVGTEQKGREALQEKQKAAGRQKLVDRRRAEDRRDDEEMNKHP